MLRARQCHGSIALLIAQIQLTGMSRNVCIGTVYPAGVGMIMHGVVMLVMMLLCMWHGRNHALACVTGHSIFKPGNQH